jgi:hypothetical protein
MAIRDLDGAPVGEVTQTRRGWKATAPTGRRVGRIWSSRTTAGYALIDHHNETKRPVRARDHRTTRR